jgi:3-oxoacid CoA-transferase B subunit
MDLVAGVKRVVVIMEHNAKDGSAKLVGECDLPMTGIGVVDLVITDLGVFEITPKGMTLIELATGVTVEEITAKTQAPFTVALSQQAA